MEPSLFISYVQKYFKGITVSVVKKLNDKNKETMRYRFMEMLTKAFSIDGKWESIIGEYTNVAADIVSMDSSLPLKKCDSLGMASGDIPKSGMKLYLTEKQLWVLDTLVANKASESEIIAELFKDLSRCIKGVYERMEFLFLRGLCEGVTEVTDTETSGVPIRMDFKYLDSNKRGVAVKWDNPETATPIDDIDSILNLASENGSKPTIVLLSRYKLRQLCACKQMKEQYYASMNLPTEKAPNLSLKKVNEFFADERGLKFDLIERTVKIEEENGTRKSVNPWNDNFLIFLSEYNVGKLVWAKCAEMNHPAKQVEYQTADEYILMSKYHKIDPLREFTSSQALVLPVITKVNDIYQLDTETIQG